MVTRTHEHQGQPSAETTPSAVERSSTTALAGRRSSALQRAGGIAALVKAVTYLVGFSVLAFYLAPRGFLEAQAKPAESLAFLLDHDAVLYVWHLVLYIVGGAALAILAVALHERLRPATPALSQAASVFGAVWAGLLLTAGLIALVGQRAVIDIAATDPATAISTWSSVRIVQDAVGGGIEIVGAAWVFLIGIAGIRSGALGRGLAGLGLGVGAAGALTLVPPVADAAASVFGLAFIVWFLWATRFMLRRPQHDG
jgi:hypothetical protein